MLTQGRGVRWHLPFRPVGLSPVFNHFSRDGGRLPRHAFPPIIPAPVSCNCGAAYPPLRGSCEFFGFSHLPFAKKFCKDLRPGTGGRLCSPNLRFWRPALSIELHPYMCASRLNCHTINQSATFHSEFHCPTAVFSGIALVVIALHKRPASTDGSDPAFRGRS